MKRKWMISERGDNFILLKRNKTIEKYSELKRVPKLLILLMDLNWVKICSIGAIILLTGMSLGVAMS